MFVWVYIESLRSFELNMAQNHGKEQGARERVRPYKNIMREDALQFVILLRVSVIQHNRSGR